MSSRRVFNLLIIILVLFLSGCGGIKKNAQDESQDFFTPLEQAKDGEFYRNTFFGYEFVIPQSTVIYGIRLEDQIAVLADEESEIVFVPGEGTNYLTARVVDTQQTAHEWLTESLLFFYPNGEAAQKIIEVDGHLAIMLRGNGSADSPARLMVVQGNEKLLVITNERYEEAFEKLVASLKID
jgi:hypothetical protein